MSPQRLKIGIDKIGDPRTITGVYCDWAFGRLFPSALARMDHEHAAEPLYRDRVDELDAVAQASSAIFTRYFNDSYWGFRDLREPHSDDRWSDALWEIRGALGRTFTDRWIAAAAMRRADEHSRELASLRPNAGRHDNALRQSKIDEAVATSLGVTDHALHSRSSRMESIRLVLIKNGIRAR